MQSCALAKLRSQDRPDINQRHIHPVCGNGSSGFLFDIRGLFSKSVSSMYTEISETEFTVSHPDVFIYTYKVKRIKHNSYDIKILF